MSTFLRTKTPWRDVLDLKQITETLYEKDFPADFAYGTRAFGGLISSLTLRAVNTYFNSPSHPKLTDIYDFKIHFLRMTSPGTVEITLTDLVVGKANATVEARFWQKNKLNAIAIISIGSFARGRGVDFDTLWRLDPAPLPADMYRMAHHTDPKWRCHQVPWHPKNPLSAISQVKMYLPLTPFSNPTIRDLWLTPADPDTSFGWTNEHLGFIAEINVSPLEEVQGEGATGTHAKMITNAAEQEQDRLAGKPLMLKATPSQSPITTFSTSLNLMVKKRLPDEGVRWLFTRSSAKAARSGLMDWEVWILDEGGELVAVATAMHQIIRLKDNPMPGGKDEKKGPSKI